MRAENCLKIKNLEERLICLKKRYLELIDSMAEERENGMISDELGNLPQILTEKEFLLKQIELTEGRIRTQERINHKRSLSSDKVDIGSQVKLKNSNHDLGVYVVAHHEANPAEGYISEDSPIGKAILGRSKGEDIDVELPTGHIHYLIEEVK